MLIVEPTPTNDTPATKAELRRDEGNLDTESAGGNCQCGVEVEAGQTRNRGRDYVALTANYLRCLYDAVTALSNDSTYPAADTGDLTL